MTTSSTNEAQIRETAYLFWLEDGQPEGRDQEHWLKAIDALTPAQAREKAAPKAKAPAKSKAAVKAAPDAKAAPAARKPRAAKAKKA